MYSKNDYRNYLEHRLMESDDYFAHFGIPGMKWRKHKKKAELAEADANKYRRWAKEDSTKELMSGSADGQYKAHNIARSISSGSSAVGHRTIVGTTFKARRLKKKDQFEKKKDRAKFKAKKKAKEFFSKEKPKSKGK